MNNNESKDELAALQVAVARVFSRKVDNLLEQIDGTDYSSADLNALRNDVTSLVAALREEIRALLRSKGG